jgi:hypothetical protein
MQTGRPLLVVPDGVDWLDLRSVLVAWKDTPECRRAVTDALPILRETKDVIIAGIVEDEADRTSVSSGIEDLVTWLLRHGVVACERVPAECGNAAARLDGIASDVGAGQADRASATQSYSNLQYPTMSSQFDSDNRFISDLNEFPSAALAAHAPFASPLTSGQLRH